MRKRSNGKLFGIILIIIITIAFYLINNIQNNKIIATNDQIPTNNEMSTNNKIDEQTLLMSRIISEVSSTSVQLMLDLDEDGTKDYTLFINGSSNKEINPTISKTELKEHKYMNEHIYYVDLAKDYGKLIITLHDVLDSGVAYYIEYIPNDSNSRELTFELKAGNSKELNLLEGYYTKDVLQYKDKKIANSTSLPNVVNYLDGDNNHIRLGRVFHETDLGRTVKSVSKIEKDIELTMNKKETSYHYTLPVKEHYSTKVEGMVSNKKLVTNKHIKFNIDTLLVMDLADKKYLWTDGVYYENPALYEPFAENDFFRTPSALHMRACYWVLDEGSIYTTYGISLMYKYAEAYNDKNYIPTKPRSGWIFQEYGIVEDFYDTRFNTDTVSSFLHMQEKYPDDEVENVIDKYFEFYVDFVENNSFYINENIFVPDYMDYNGNDQVPHCSLNHMLSEMTVLYRYHLLYDNTEYFHLAEKLLNSILNTKDEWVKSNGDLYYCITKDGEYIRDDYPLVTYNDLMRAEYYINKIYGEVPKGYLEMKDAKEKWAKKNGYLK
ncbi:MAG: hypothetical protein N4A50_02015 [Vallitalea sp.]|jgi:hypothetical protein|nr:hypothetical protein [Vallitalea sp.]